MRAAVSQGMSVQGECRGMVPGVSQRGHNRQAQGLPEIQS